MISKYSLKDGSNYWVYNDDHKLPNLIMLHGLRGTHHGLDLIAKGLKGYRVIIPDLPGFGSSKPLKVEHSIENYAGWTDEFIGNLKLSKKPVLLGHSFGTIIASCFAAQHPGKISKLILENPVATPPLQSRRVVATRISAGYYKLGEILPEKIGTALLRSKIATILMGEDLSSTKDRKLMKFIHSEHLKHFNSFYNRQMMIEAFKASTNRCVGQYAAQITTPTLIIAGRIDGVTEIERQEELVKKFPDAKLDIIDQVGHFTHYETPGDVVASVERFLS